jgi:GAF domain-containing protein
MPFFHGASLLSNLMPHDFQADLDAISAIPAVPAILEVVCRTTGMRFAAVARVTDDRWVCCASRDDIGFGLVPGGELWVETTICDEIRGSRTGVAIDHVAEDPVFQGHPTPAAYGFQSYISMPIMLADGSFFGTLCSIDPHPNTLNNPTVTGMFKLFADLIAFHLDAHHKLVQAERDHARRNERFKAGLGHDMRNTLAAIEAGTRLLARTPLNERGALIVREMELSAQKLAQQISDVAKAAD